MLRIRNSEDFRFRCKALPGTQEMRTKIGHLGFWASVNYGNGIFITISPGERHNYLALKFSRYRSDDPFIRNWMHPEWAGPDKPHLEPKPEDTYSVDIPGYDMRRIMSAEDPLAAANAFFVQIRTVLATVLGIRMCPFCPHCDISTTPCQNSFGSVAELMGGIIGCIDAMF